MESSSYYGRVAARALEMTLADFGLERPRQVAIKVLWLGVTVLLLWAVGAVEQVIAEIGKAGATAVGLALLLALLYLGNVARAAAELYGDLEKRIAALEGKRKTQADLKKLCEQLSIHMMRGRDLMARCSEAHREPRPTDNEIDVWHHDTRSFIVKELGSVYFARLETPDVPPINQIADARLNMLWNGLRYRVLNLRKFVEELSKS